MNNVTLSVFWKVLERMRAVQISTNNKSRRFFFLSHKTEFLFAFSSSEFVDDSTIRRFPTDQRTVFSFLSFFLLSHFLFFSFVISSLFISHALSHGWRRRKGDRAGFIWPLRLEIMWHYGLKLWRFLHYGVSLCLYFVWRCLHVPLDDSLNGEIIRGTIVTSKLTIYNSWHSGEKWDRLRRTPVSAFMNPRNFRVHSSRGHCWTYDGLAVVTRVEFQITAAVFTPAQSREVGAKPQMLKLRLRCWSYATDVEATRK